MQRLAFWITAGMLVRCSSSPPPAASEMVFENRHVDAFFRLLEEETSRLDFRTPIRIKTAKQFAGRLFVHPNHLNMLLKRHTGLNVSAHIKRRILEQSMLLLTGTDWTLETISYTIGFSDQPNFSQFFKKCTGVTPAEYRKSRLFQRAAVDSRVYAIDV